MTFHIHFYYILFAFSILSIMSSFYKVLFIIIMNFIGIPFDISFIQSEIQKNCLLFDGNIK